jgi:multiple sugar transport system permease protein
MSLPSAKAPPRDPPTDATPRRRRRGRGERSAPAVLLLAGPAFLLLVVFLILPFFMAVGVGFTNQRLISPDTPDFIGLDNYKRLLTVRVLTLEPETDPATGEALTDDEGTVVYPAVRDFTRDADTYPQYAAMSEWFRIGAEGNRQRVVLASDVVFMRAVVNTLIFAAIIAPVQGGLGLALAVLVNRRTRGVNVFRTIYFMPVVTSMVVISVLWAIMYDEQNGLINQLVNTGTFGLVGPINWLGNPSTALPAIIIMSVWQGVGFNMIVWLSGIQTIPAVLYEAASVDGANPWQQFRHVTWPGLRNTAVFVLITITIAAFGLFTQVDVMTGGGPLDSTTTVVHQAVRHGFRQQNIAYGSVISVVFFLIVLFVALVQRRLTREKD